MPCCDSTRCHAVLVNYSGCFCRRVEHRRQHQCAEKRRECVIFIFINHSLSSRHCPPEMGILLLARHVCVLRKFGGVIYRTSHPEGLVRLLTSTSWGLINTSGFFSERRKMNYLQSPLCVWRS